MQTTFFPLIIYCLTRGMGEKPSSLGEDFCLIVDAAFYRDEGIDFRRNI